MHSEKTSGQGGLDFFELSEKNQRLFRVVALARPLFGDGIDELWLESVPHRIPVRMELTNGPELNVKRGDYLTVIYKGVKSEFPPECIKGSDITATYSHSTRQNFYHSYPTQTIRVDGNPIYNN